VKSASTQVDKQDKPQGGGPSSVRARERSEQEPADRATVAFPSPRNDPAAVRKLLAEANAAALFRRGSELSPYEQAEVVQAAGLVVPPWLARQVPQPRRQPKGRTA
jgi:hypothetical protein